MYNNLSENAGAQSAFGILRFYERRDGVTRDQKQSASSGLKRPSSLILSKLDCFCDAVYSKLADGFFGFVFSTYPRVENTVFGRFCTSRTRKNVLTPARRKVAEKLESSAIAALYRRFISYLLTVRIKVYGAFVFSFLMYSAVFSTIGYFRGTTEDLVTAIIPAIVSLGAVPSFFSGMTLAQAICSSYTGRFLLYITGIRPERLDTEKRHGRGDAAFVLALLCSIATVWFDFWIILLVFLVAAGAAIIAASPEFGTLCLFFAAPLLPTWGLFALAMLTIVSFLIKALLAKRVFRIEAVDIALFPLVLTFVGGTVFGASWMSLKSGSAILVFLLCYYLAVFTLTTREWLRRCVISLLVSCTGVSVYGLLQYVWQKNASADMNEWVDSEMFGFIEARAISTLENPNMLSVYLITVLPIALMALIVLARNLRERTLALVAVGSIGLCLIFTWSRGAWLGTIVALFLFIIIWSRRSIYAFIVGILSLPFLSYIVPANIWARFTSIGNLNDTSSSYRVGILKQAFRFLPEFIFNGLGLGEESWEVIWFSGVGNEAAVVTSHSHNLYVQIWLQTGLISLIFFFVFILFLFLANFNFYKRLRGADDVVMSHISLAPMKDAPLTVEGAVRKDLSATKKKTTMRLEAAAPLCGVFATLVMGFTDYTWTNFRVMLSFWLVCGLSAAYVRVGRRELEYFTVVDSPEEAETNVVLEKKRSDKNRNTGIHRQSASDNAGRGSER